MAGFLDSNPDLADFLQALSQLDVRYLVVGGHAVSVHAAPRATKDLDVWLDDTPENRSALLRALKSYGAPAEIVDHVRASGSTDIVWFGRPPNRIDLLFDLPGVSFEKAFANATYVMSGLEQVSIIGPADLLANKRTVDRPQDRADVAALEANGTDQSP